MSPVLPPLLVPSPMHNSLAFCLFVIYCTEKEHQHDPDDDSGVGPSISTDTKSTTFSEVSYYSSSVV